MEHAVPGGKGSMAAVLGMTAETVDAGLSGMEGVSVANYNCPGQIVITGWKEQVEKAAMVLKEAGAKRVLPLKVSGPFHSPMLQEAGACLEEVLEAMPFSQLQVPYVTNVTAKYVWDIRQFNGEGGECSLCGCVIADKNQHVDNNTLIDHKVGRCNSHELYKYVLDDKSTGAFAGRILVRKDAQKTTSHETNQNICVTKEIGRAHV